ncbi:MAG: hypothetical protein KDE51_00910 [Anaerolineales bacterium]|nr:hypothetical protein [Anaerolineales bacterium]
MKLIWKLAAVYTAALTLLGCSLAGTPEATPLPTLPPPTATIESPTATPLPLEITPFVESIDVLITFEEITAVMRGNLTADCWEMAEPIYVVNGGTIEVDLLARRPETAACTSGNRPFESRLVLPAGTLADGFYVVTVNQETSSSFAYSRQNLQNNGLLTISGRVWHDLCAWKTGDSVDLPPVGCLATAAGYRGNGQFDQGETGLAQVLVQLGVGECPAAPLLSAVTDQSGAYSFPAVGVSQYCVMILTEGNSNELLLMPGVWTAPAETAGESVGYLTVSQATDTADFGWDYALLPLSNAQQSCDDKGLLIGDVTYPAGTRVGAGETITKTWQVQNVGTCTWTTDYGLQWIDGRVTSPDYVPLPRPILPGEIAEISVTVQMPQGFGTFSGRWWFKNANGELFGTGINRDRTLSLELRGPAPPPTVTPVPVPTADETEG